MPSLLGWLQESALATTIRDSLLLFPLLESAHVIGLALVFGTIVIVDLRLLGLASTERPVSRVVADTLVWTWTGFALTVATGLLMFVTNATGYFENTYFRAKIVLLALAGLNAAVFQFAVWPTRERWQRGPQAPPLGRAVAVASVVLWLAVIVAGRMIGFTATRAAVPDAPAELDFEQLLGFPGDDAPADPAAPAPDVP